MLYHQQAVQFPTQLVPYSSGLVLTRSNSIVAHRTPVFLLGDLTPVLQGIDITKYSIYVNGVRYGQPSSPSINIQLNQYTNPSTLQEQEAFTCEISTADKILFKNSSVSISPPLEAIVVGQSKVGITAPETVRVNENIELLIEFDSVETFDSLELTTPIFCAEVVSCAQVDGDSQVSLSAQISSQNQTSQTILIKKANSQKFSTQSIRLTVKAVPYQQNVDSALNSAILEWESPSTVHTSPFGIRILGAPLDAQVTLGSLRTNNITNYLISVKTIAKAGKLVVTLP